MRWIRDDLDQVSEHIIAGVSAAQFKARTMRLQRRLAYYKQQEKTAAKRANRQPGLTPQYEEMVITAPPWGWLHYLVNIDGAVNLIGFGIRRPGARVPLALAARAQHRNSTLLVSIGAGSGGIATMITGFASGMTTAVELPLVAATVCAGAAVGWKSMRYLDSTADDSRLMVFTDYPDSPDDETRLSAAENSMIRFAQVRCALSTYQREMAAASKQDSLEPLALPNGFTPSELVDHLHQAVWDLVADESADSPADIFDGIEDIVGAVDTAIESAWSTRRASIVKEDAAIPFPPQQPRRRTVEDLRSLQRSLAKSLEAAHQGEQDLRRLNGHDSDTPRQST